LPKLDQFAISDFASGAMENWGLITYHTNSLLVHENTSPSERIYVKQVVAHEIVPKF